MPQARDDELLNELVVDFSLDDSDRERLAALHAKLGSQRLQIAEQIQARFTRRPTTAPLAGTSEPIVQLRAALTEWMTAGLSGDHGDPFFATSVGLARRCIDAGISQRAALTAMSMVRREHHDRIERLYEPVAAQRVLRSLGKLIDIELALIMREYQRDASARIEARDRNAQADRVAAVRTLSAGLAHELRNPLNSAKLQLELLERRLGTETDRKLLEPLEQVGNELDRLSRLLSEFLSFVRPADLSLAEHDVASIARDVVATARLLAGTRGATLQLHGPDTLPARVDVHKLRQILQNLVNNALEAVADHGRVTVSVDAGDEHTIRLSVEDNGPGIPDAIRHRIYEPFFTTKDGGTGLGLSIVHSMTALHGGTITCDSQPRATRFDVVLPRRFLEGRAA